jgi:SAM-dependent methyltransferase
MYRTGKNSVLLNSGNISYYDRIANRYDDIQSGDKKNSLLRDLVTGYFLSRVKCGHVLDFGGGTGLDLNWLVRQQYNISFCEPSESMRRIAIERKHADFPQSSIVFLEGDQCDFRKWNAEFPFGEKINAVLANFAVLNCIPDIQCLFEKLRLVLAPGGFVVALVLDGSLLRKFRTSFKGAVKYLFNRSPVGFQIIYEGQTQYVNLYSIFEISKAANPGFELVHQESLDGFGFSLIHLMRK